MITAIIHVCQAPFDHGLDVVLCLLFTQLILWLKLKVTFGSLVPVVFLPGPKNEYYFLVVLLNQCSMVGS